MTELTINIEILLFTCAAIITFSTAAGILWRTTKPIRDAGAELAELRRRSERDFKRLQQLEHDIKTIGKAIWILLAHVADGNHTGKIPKVLEELSVALMGFEDE